LIQCSIEYHVNTLLHRPDPAAEFQTGERCSIFIGVSISLSIASNSAVGYLVLTVGFRDYGICVDTHVYRISSLWGYVKTRTPEETKLALRKKLPKRHWKTYNDILVTFGQNPCVPVSPWCSKGPIAKFCPRIGL